MPTYSHSRLETFEQCPCKYKLAYIDRVEVETGETIEQFLGSRIHEVLEQHYRDLIVTKVNALEDLLRLFDAGWRAQWTKDIRIVKPGRTAEHYRQSGRRAIEKYYARYQPFDQDTTIACELRLGFDLGGHAMTGYIDRLCHDGRGNFAIHDYKASGTIPPASKFEHDRQLALYQIGVAKQYSGIKSFKLIWHYLLFDLEFTSQRSQKQLADLERQTIGLIERVESETRFAPHESNLCSWCEYYELCPAKAHELKTATLPKNEYLKEPGVKLVGEYAKLRELKADLNEKIREIEQEQSKIEAAALDYAKREKVAKIAGRDYAFHIAEHDALQFPGVGQDGRDKLEAFLKKQELWEQAASLNVKSLPRVLEDDSVDASVRKKLAGFGEQVHVTDIRFRKRAKKDDE